MKRLLSMTAGLVMTSVSTMSVLAGEAETNAAAGTGWNGRGTAAATARYDGADGNIGLARTRTRTGEVNLAEGLAVGVDRDGLDFSFSEAIAPRFGPAFGGTFNLSIGMDGDVSGSFGTVVAEGGRTRSVEAGGVTRTDSRGATAAATAHGDTSPNGRVIARTNSYSRPQVYRPVVYKAVPRFAR